MRYKAQPLLGNQLACDPAHAVGLVLDTDKRGLEVLDEFVLPLGELAGLFLGKLISAIVLNRLE